MLEEGGEGNRVRGRQGGHRALTVPKRAEHGAPDRVGQSDEGVIEPAMVNHKDNYYRKTVRSSRGDVVYACRQCGRGALIRRATMSFRSGMRTISPSDGVVR